MTLLREELGVPSPTTRKLYEQLLREDEPSIAEALTQQFKPSPTFSD
jgi:hypothetical protein